MERDGHTPVGISTGKSTLVAILIAMAFGCLGFLTWSVTKGAEGLIGLLDL